MTLGLAIALSVMGNLESEEVGSSIREEDRYAWSAQAMQERQRLAMEESERLNAEHLKREMMKHGSIDADYTVIDGDYVAIEDKSDGRE